MGNEGVKSVVIPRKDVEQTQQIQFSLLPYHRISYSYLRVMFFFIRCLFFYDILF